MQAAYPDPAPAPDTDVRPEPPLPWWQRPAVVVALLILFPPAGIALAWLTGWPRRTKIIATVASGLWLIALLLIPSASGDGGDAEDTAGPPTPATPSGEPSPDASGDAAGEHEHEGGHEGGHEHEGGEGGLGEGEFTITEVPDYTGGTLGDAMAAAQETGYQVVSHHAVDGLPPEGAGDDWTVCSHAPAAGAPAATYTIVDFAVVPPGTDCPETPQTFATPETGPADPAEPTEPVSEPSLPEAEPAPHDDAPVHYDNCDDVRAAGRSPLYAGDPGYRDGLDRDGDGVACE